MKRWIWMLSLLNVHFLYMNDYRDQLPLGCAYRLHKNWCSDLKYVIVMDAWMGFARQSDDEAKEEVLSQSANLCRFFFFFLSDHWIAHADRGWNDPSAILFMTSSVWGSLHLWSNSSCVWPLPYFWYSSMTLPLSLLMTIYVHAFVINCELY